MASRTKNGPLIIIAVFISFFLVLISAYAQAADYIYVYDDLNRVIRVVYDDGTVISYTYDEVGNRLEERIGIDTTPPTTSASPPGGAYVPPFAVTLQCLDDGVGCDKIYYTTDGSDPTTSSPVYSSPINISAATTLKFFGKDLLGYSETPFKTEIYTITIDTTPPTGTITINGGAAFTNALGVTLTLSCSDTSGCAQMKFSDDNINYSAAETYNTSKAWTLPSGDGTKTVYVKFKDTPGNWSDPFNDTILLDTTPPTNPTSCTETHGAPNGTSQSSVSDPAFTWSGASDSGSGVKGYYWYFGTSSSADPTNWTTTQGCDPPAVPHGTYYLRVKTEDNAGNRSSAVTLFTFIYGGW